MHGAILKELAVECWTNPAASQGLVIPPFAVYLAWLRRRSVARVPAEIDYRGLAAIAIGCGMLLVGRLGAEFFLSRLSFVVVASGILWTFWGAGRLRILALPLLLLATMVPLPNIVSSALSGPLQLLASDMAARAAELAGITLYREGNILRLADISLGIEEACSGLTSLSSLMVAGVLFGFLICRSPLLRGLIFCAAFPAAILANILRVTGTAILSDWEPELAMGFYHAFSGWLVFLVGASVLYGIAHGLRRLEA
jgi:exosortase